MSEQCRGTCAKHGKPCIVSRCSWKGQSGLPIRDCDDEHTHVCIECVKEQQQGVKE